jgi:uncharacterized Ntn-hydrolase superfamily protein
MAELVSTYSIAACDLEAGQWGVATQSKFLAVGSVVPWAEPQVGAIATQAYANPSYGPDGLALLRDGLSAEEVVERLTTADEGRNERQLGIVDGEGRGASFTGAECLDWAGGRTGPSYAAQGNILVSAETVEAIAASFESSTGPLAERLLDCLDAAQAAGGDRRGQQSAALLVVEKDGGYGSRTTNARSTSSAACTGCTWPSSARHRETSGSRSTTRSPTSYGPGWRNSATTEISRTP